MRQYYNAIGELLTAIEPKVNKAEKTSVFLECGPMQWTSGEMKGGIYGPFKNAAQAHNYIAVKIDRHRLSNADYHREEGRPPQDDRTYWGHPMFQYRIMSAREYFGRYYAQIVQQSLQGLIDLNTEDEPDVFWPNRDGPVEGILDDDEWTEGEETET